MGVYYNKFYESRAENIIGISNTTLLFLTICDQDAVISRATSDCRRALGRSFRMPHEFPDDYERLL